MGPHDAGFHLNFALGSLVLDEASDLHLVDLADNSDGDEAEAVYVLNLMVPATAKLDLGGLNLYARSGDVSGIVEGGEIPWMIEELSVHVELAEHSLVLSWPLLPEGVVLERTARLSAPIVWNRLTDSTPVATEGHWTVALEVQDTTEFFRLVRP